MDVEQAPGVARTNAGRQHAHEAGEHHQLRPLRIDARGERRARMPTRSARTPRRSDDAALRGPAPRAPEAGAPPGGRQITRTHAGGDPARSRRPARSRACCCRGRRSGSPAARCGRHASMMTPPPPARTSPMTRALSPRARSSSSAAVGWPGGDDDHHADAAIEGAVHLGVAHVAGLRQPLEHRIARPAGSRAAALRCPSGSTRGMLSVRPPPVMCASPWTGRAASEQPSSASRRCAWARAGGRTAAARPARVAALAPATSMSLRISE